MYDFTLEVCVDSVESAVQAEAGGGIHGPEDVKLLYETGIRNFHMSGKKSVESQMEYRNPEVSMGLPLASEYSLWRTDAKCIEAVSMLRKKL